VAITPPASSWHPEWPSGDSSGANRELYTLSDTQAATGSVNLGGSAAAGAVRRGGASVAVRVDLRPGHR
jgi:hypothetical protein